MSKNAKPASINTSDPPASFESAMDELEKIVGSMESSELSLEASLAAHKRGLELARYCQELLTQAQQQVTVLEENMLKTLGDSSSMRTDE
jgi:exodeoxyribonuclease VII small subunit